MTTHAATHAVPDSDAVLAGLLFAVNPHGLGGVVLRGMPGPVRDRWLKRVQDLLPECSPWLKVPVNVSNDRLLGGLDFAATIGNGRPVFATGLLEAADSGVLLLSMAERMPANAAAILGTVLDRGEVQVERDGVARKRSSRFGIVALDEGIDDECLTEGLAERLAFCVQLAEHELAGLDFDGWNKDLIAKARRRLAVVRFRHDVVDRVCRSAIAFGIPSLRAEILTLRAASALAALQGRKEVCDMDAARAARLVLPQRARCVPQPEPESEAEAPEPQPVENEFGPPEKPADQDLSDDVIVDAIRAALPPDLLARLQRSAGRRMRKVGGGRGGPRDKCRRRGRPVGVKPAESAGRDRLNVLATLKAAAPWQRLRSQASTSRPGALHIRKEDLHVTRFKDRVETTTVFVVDASGSQAAQRLAEVKGAIELLLSDCYVRRDQVALIAFRHTQAEILLPPTRALARAKRSLAALPGGGATPLATGIDMARGLAESIAGQGRTPAIVLLTDGRANITRDSKQGAARAEEDALAAGRLLNAAGIDSLLVDTSRRPRPRARQLADAMGAAYVPLPRANAETITAAVQGRGA